MKTKKIIISFLLCLTATQVSGNQGSAGNFCYAQAKAAAAAFETNGAACTLEYTGSKELTYKIEYSWSYTCAKDGKYTYAGTYQCQEPKCTEPEVILDETGLCGIPDECDSPTFCDECDDIGATCTDNGGVTHECIAINLPHCADDGGGGNTPDTPTEPTNTDEIEEKLDEIDLTTKTEMSDEIIEEYIDTEQRKSDTWYEDDFDMYSCDKSGTCTEISPDDLSIYDPEKVTQICTKDGSSCQQQPKASEEAPWIYPEPIKEIEPETTKTEEKPPEPTGIDKITTTKTRDPDNDKVIITVITIHHKDGTTERSTTRGDGTGEGAGNGHGTGNKPGNSEEPTPAFCVWAVKACEFFEDVLEFLDVEDLEDHPEKDQVFKNETLSIDALTSLTVSHTAAQCPEPVPIQINSFNLSTELNLSGICQIATDIRPLVLVLSLLVSARIITRGMA